jgi:hypothetical protein
LCWIGAASGRRKSEEPPLLLPIVRQIPGEHCELCFFLPLAGISTVRQITNNPIDIKATGRLNKLYVELLKDNEDWGPTHAAMSSTSAADILLLRGTHGHLVRCLSPAR